MSEEDLFVEAMGKVRPIGNKPDKVAPRTIKPRPQRLEKPVGHAQPATDSSVHPAFESSESPWELLANGVSRDRLKRILASEKITRTLDLHGMTRQEALTLLAAEMAVAAQGSARLICVIHGRGRHSVDKPVLKEAVYHWLREGPLAPSILAAVPQPGSGGGACLILLRRK